nr:replication initiation protein [Microvirus sp.]
MGCNKPLIRFYIPEDREASGKVYSLASLSIRTGKPVKYEDFMYRKDVMMIPCGQCQGCRLKKRKEWATRMELEAYQHKKEEIWFITLTYDDEKIPSLNLKTGEIFRGGKHLWKDGSERPQCVQTLNVEDVQLFIKRLRKGTRARLRYFLAGEYGDKTGRPHYHMILYGWEPKKLKPIHKMSRFGHFTDEDMQKWWGNGQIDIAQATPETYNYVAGYVTKKLYGNDSKRYTENGLKPPFCIMSRKPGLGDKWFQDHENEIWAKGYIQLSNGKIAAIPEYYWKKLEAKSPERAWNIKRHRQWKAIEQLKQRAEQTDKSYKQQLDDKEQAMSQKMRKAKGHF